MTSYFKLLCDAFYIKSVHKSKPKFLNELLKAAGNAFGVTDKSHATKIYNGNKPFTESIREGFNNSEVNCSGIANFFEDIFVKYKQDLMLVDLARSAGIEIADEIEASYFFQACAALVNAEIFNPHHGISLTSWYQRATESKNLGEALMRKPLAAGDSLLVSRPPALQQYLLSHWETFEHQWTIQNKGSVIWLDRYLVCENSGSEKHFRLSSPECIPIGRTAPNEFARLSATFQTRGHDGTGVSRWRMVDANGNDCFSNHQSDFDVQVTVSFDHTKRNGG
ncbi:NBR1-Ig-like domain-containing protein [Canibacter zhoujuaniae]|uniref:NBR1-Ig-like domain-containing protein n=1 Tax=Canibacter zhoujuaniae TaxID=2708343 RepID=UPI0014236B66|nr:NBR1-Ig-like domain-containing protein [Canibacter zhoujuaniae]